MTKCIKDFFLKLFGCQKDDPNIGFEGPPELCWSDGKRRDSLKLLADYVTEQGSSIIGWYLNRKGAKRWWAIKLRLVAILSGAVGALTPVVVGLFWKDVETTISTGAAAIFLGIAAAAVLLDRFFGFSSAWMRFLTYELEVRRVLHEYLMDWEYAKVEWESANREPVKEEVLHVIARCREALRSFNWLLVEELEEWKREFQSALSDADRRLREAQTAAASYRPGPGGAAPPGVQTGSGLGPPPKPSKPSGGADSAPSNAAPSPHSPPTPDTPEPEAAPAPGDKGGPPASSPEASPAKPPTPRKTTPKRNGQPE